MSIIYPPVILGAGNGCANFYGRLAFFVLSAGKPHAHKIPRVRGGGVVGVLEGGGGSANFIFMGVGIFSDKRSFL